MNLYCHACHVNHRFTAGEVERIVYALDATQADKGAEPADPNASGWHDLECFEVVLRGSHDTEVYYEHVENCVENRRLALREEQARDA
jgi:hypothetical protein